MSSEVKSEVNCCVVFPVLHETLGDYPHRRIFAGDSSEEASTGLGHLPSSLIHSIPSPLTGVPIGVLSPEIQNNLAAAHNLHTMQSLHNITGSSVSGGVYLHPPSVLPSLLYSSLCSSLPQTTSDTNAIHHLHSAFHQHSRSSASSSLASSSSSRERSIEKTSRSSTPSDSTVPNVHTYQSKPSDLVWRPY